MYYERVSIETASFCNRRCATCLRQSYPDRDRVEPWFTQNLMPTETVYAILDQARDVGFWNIVCFNLYNEPMFDSRLPEFGRYAKQLGFADVMFASNGDLLDEPMVRSLDGCFDRINVSPYDEKDRQRLEAMAALFTETRLRFTNGLHFLTHCFSGDDPELEEVINRRCFNVARNMAINHQGDCLACCQEIVPHNDFGNIHTTSLKDMLEAKVGMIRSLRRNGNRKHYPYCATCLRGSHKEYVQVVAQ